MVSDKTKFWTPGQDPLQRIFFSSQLIMLDNRCQMLKVANLFCLWSTFTFINVFITNVKPKTQIKNDHSDSCFDDCQFWLTPRLGSLYFSWIGMGPSRLLLWTFFNNKYQIVVKYCYAIEIIKLVQVYSKANIFVLFL